MPKRGHTPPPIRVDRDLGYVPLTQGMEAVVDADDVPLIAHATWHARQGRNTWYAATNDKIKRGRMIRLHQILLGTVGTSILVDHRDGNGLNNRRSNLRVASNQQNVWNGRPRSEGYKGVYEVPQGFIAQITVNGRHLYLGTHLTPEDAAHAYDVAARQHFDEFASTNFQDDAPPQEYLTAGRLATKLNVSRATITRWARTGRLEFITTPGGHRRFKEASHDQT